MLSSTFLDTRAAPYLQNCTTLFDTNVGRGTEPYFLTISLSVVQ